MTLPPGPFDIIYADPPWTHRGGSLAGESSAAVAAHAHYPTMSTGKIAALPVAEVVAADALLFLWAVWPNLPDALDVGRAWSFAYSTCAFVWDKQAVLPGRYTMAGTEPCLLFKRGRIPEPRGARNVKQFLSTPRDEHSRKPDAFRRAIDAMFPTQRKLELFARTQPEGWTAAGNETGKFPAPPPRLF